MNNKKDYIDFIEENLAESFIAVIFLIAFIGVGVISGYFIDNALIKDIVIATCTIIGTSALVIKIFKGN